MPGRSSIEQTGKTRKTRYESPPEVLRLSAADAPSANGRRPEPGEPYGILTVPLADGRRLVLELSDEELRQLRRQLTECEQPCCVSAASGSAF